ncbi:hypothetical protein LTR96_005518 [Exophiala xenobiotica]|uniref:C2H2-type domain-containing protein n=1 Tax=Vermiconidia calcicola TaxID=1690605 RepID=A0AAV9PQR7_9PEZI|nr:hypothetical protein LTR41_005545 [Exophiala xenobiotica]KAK5527915.1 hypothetical protein LTR25_010846 [Vermiconidia calcicola]KAK5234267.1 hypothetical protein LTR47_004858 [Exophiala xenobiotica]KAK5269820.1 hypothetical protein LTR96_005518 [Exophiala xenobiotica]KAK5313908.1 hypothetical protein LTR93_010678 [Exophiala xenobiotica]
MAVFTSNAPVKSRADLVCRFCSRHFAKKDHLTRHERIRKLKTTEYWFVMSAPRLTVRNRHRRETLQVDVLTRHIRSHHSENAATIHNSSAVDVPQVEGVQGQQSECQTGHPILSAHTSSGTVPGPGADYWPGLLSGPIDTFTTPFNENSNVGVSPLQMNSTARATTAEAEDRAEDRLTGTGERTSQADHGGDLLANLIESSLGVTSLSQSPTCPRQELNVPTGRQARHSHSLTSREEIAPERFARVERLWPAPRQPLPRSMRAFWTDVADQNEDNAFGLVQASNVAEATGNQKAHHEHGWTDVCHKRLYKYCKSAVLPQLLDDNSSSSHGALVSSMGSDTESNMASAASSTVDFPESRFLEISIGLYFRRYHAMVPFIHQATFSAAATSDSLLLSMCLMGLISLEDSGATNFVREQMPGAIERCRSELASRSIRKSRLSQTLCALAAAVLLLHLSAMVPEFVQAERVHLLYVESIGLAQRNSMFVVDGESRIDTRLWDKHSDPEASWMAWSRIESVKRLIASIVLIDSSQARRFDTMPIINVDQLCFVLPCAPELFDARNSKRWRALIQNGVADAASSFELTENDLRLPPELTDFGLQSILGSVWLRVLHRRSRLKPAELSAKRGDSPPLISPAYVCESNPEALGVAQVVLTVFGTYANFFPHTDVNNFVMWNNISLHLCTHYSLFEVAVGRYGAEQANPALNQLSQSWVHTPAARRACLHAAQTFLILSRCRASDRITVQSEAAAFESALVLGIYLYLLPESQGVKAAGGGNEGGAYRRESDREYEYEAKGNELDQDVMFELLEYVDWKAVGSVGMPSDRNLIARPEAADQDMPALCFLKQGGAVTFSGSPLYGGFESARSVFVEFLGLLQDIGKWNVQRFCHILRVLSVTTMEDGIFTKEPGLS